jgi:hypothetical protein
MKALALVWLIAHAAGPEDALPGPQWDGATFRAYSDEAANVSFEVPLTQFRVESRHFDEAKVGQARHLLVLSGPEGAEVTVDVFYDAGPAEAGRFFEEHLPFLRQPEVSIASVMVEGPRLPGLLFVQPRMQAFARRTVLFASGERVVRITCLNADDTRTRAVFERVLKTFHLEGER